jgi:glycosyltransferase involved in cell wall biosynthesis
MRVLTVATMRTLARARALAASLRRHQPDWALELVLVGGEEAIARAASEEPGLAVRSASRALEIDIEGLLARHDEEDLTILVLPRLLEWALAEDGAPVLHLPSSAWILGALDPLVGELERTGVVLVPRTSSELPPDGLEPSREQLDRAGRIDATLMAVDRSPRARDFLGWWGAHTEQSLGSLDGVRVGDRPEDRPWLGRFLELAPARFSTGTLDDASFNLSLWNLHGHKLEERGEAVIVDGARTLRLLNLPGFDPDRPHRLAANASRARVSGSAVLRGLCERYAAELRAAGWNDAEHRHEIGRRLSGGLVYDESLRAIYGRALALGEDFGDVFSDEGSEAFLGWLAQPAPRGAAQGINRYVFYRVSRERPDVLRAYPDIDGRDGAELVSWCWSYGRAELQIPDRFMPPRTSDGRPSADLPKSAPRRSRPAAAPDELAVRVTGFMGHTLGLGAAARGYVEALREAGVPVSTVTVPLHHLALPVRLEDAYGRHGFEDVTHVARPAFDIVAVNADELPDFFERLGEGYFEGRRIGIWGWETNSIPARWQRAFGLVDEIWVYSRFMAENIGASSPVPVIALPPPVHTAAEPIAATRLGVPEGFLFLFVFDYLSTVQRKNPVGLIEAFKLAFAHREGPQLLIKTINGPLRPLSEEELLWAAHGREDIHVIDRSLAPGDLNGLMAGCDCYVSLHRAEGLGLTIAEAMALGKPAIATGYSGNLDFMNEDNSYLVDYVIGRVGPECEIYPPEGEWAEPNIEHAAELMRRVLADPDEAARKARRASEDIARLLSPAATGRRMRERLQELAGTAGAGVAAARA